jgi:hypothetical protein
MLERGGKVRTQVIPERRKKIVEQIVRENIMEGSEVHTDEFAGIGTGQGLRAQDHILKGT